VIRLARENYSTVDAQIASRRQPIYWGTAGVAGRADHLSDSLGAFNWTDPNSSLGLSEVEGWAGWVGDFN
jgi:hypothetical protein